MFTALDPGKEILASRVRGFRIQALKGLWKALKNGFVSQSQLCSNGCVTPRLVLH